MSQKSVLEETSTLNFVCDKAKVAYSRPRKPGEGSTMRTYYGGDEPMTHPASIDEFDDAIEMGKNPLTGKPESGLLNHFKLVAPAPEKVIEDYRKFMDRSATKEEIAAMHPTNMRLLAEKLGIEGFDRKETPELVTPIFEKLESNHEAEYKRMKLAAEHKQKAGISKADLSAENAELKAKLAELENGNKEKTLDKMNKDELTAKAKELEVEVTEDMTKAKILEAIRAK